MQYGSGWGVEGTSSSPVIATFFPQRNNPGNIIVDVAINNLNTNLTTDEYLNKLMQEIVNPYIKFNIHTTNKVSTLQIILDIYWPVLSKGILVLMH